MSSVHSGLSGYTFGLGAVDAVFALKYLAMLLLDFFFFSSS